MNKEKAMGETDVGKGVGERGEETVICRVVYCHCIQSSQPTSLAVSIQQHTKVHGMSGVEHTPLIMRGYLPTNISFKIMSL